MPSCPQQTCGLEVCVNGRVEMTKQTQWWILQHFQSVPALGFKHCLKQSSGIGVSRCPSGRSLEARNFEQEGGGKLSVDLSVFSPAHRKRLHIWQRDLESLRGRAGVCCLKKSLHTTAFQHHWVRSESGFPDPVLRSKERGFIRFLVNEVESRLCVFIMENSGHIQREQNNAIKSLYLSPSLLSTFCHSFILQTTILFPTTYL